MKWVKSSLLVVLLVAALYFAYNSFEASFNPRRGTEGKSGQHAMSPAMVQAMQKASQKKKVGANKKAVTKGSDGKQGKEVTAAKQAALDATSKKGGE